MQVRPQRCAAAQGVDKVVTHFVENCRTSLVAYGSRPGNSVRKLFVPKSSKTAAHVAGILNGSRRACGPSDATHGFVDGLGRSDVLRLFFFGGY